MSDERNNGLFGGKNLSILEVMRPLQTFQISAVMILTQFSELQKRKTMLRLKVQKLRVKHLHLQ